MRCHLAGKSPKRRIRPRQEPREAAHRCITLNPLITSLSSFDSTEEHIKHDFAFGAFGIHPLSATEWSPAGNKRMRPNAVASWNTPATKETAAAKREESNRQVFGESWVCCTGKVGCWTARERACPSTARRRR
jgi:hypothetical protein